MPNSNTVSKSDSSKKIPILIFTGFLGSGKTTLVNTLINQHKELKIGVVVNEFGEVGFDSEIIQTEEEIKVEISNGCACCVVRDDLQAGVEALIKQVPNLDYIFIETSGLAEPEPIVQTFLHNIAFDRTAYLDATICTIDTVNFVKNWDEFETLQKQLTYSDIVVLTKVEEEDTKKDEVAEILRKAKPDMQIIEFSQSNPAVLDILMDTHSFELTEIGHEHKEHGHNHKDNGDHDHHSHPHKHEHEEFDEMVFVTDKKLDPNKMDDVFALPQFANVIRAKGFLNFDGRDETLVFQLVGHGRQLSPYSKRLDQNKLVLIGKDLDTKALMESLESCIVQK